MATNIGFVLSAVIAVGIVSIGGRFLAAPSLAATGYGVPAGTAPYARAYLQGRKLTHDCSINHLVPPVKEGPGPRMP